MPIYLKYVEVENFKSYRGKIRIGPLKFFNAVIGPNGSGKSNFMDAVSFVMGQRASKLRVKKFTDLIHGASIDKPYSISCSVTAVFGLEDGAEQSFMRTVNNRTLNYSINTKHVSQNEYLHELKKLGIDINANNFLVYQGEVESLAYRNSKELTRLFEEISGSGDFKEEYERLRLEMIKAEREIQLSFLAKRNITKACKQVRLQKNEADEYNQLNADLEKKQIELQLFRLFHNEKEMKELEEELKCKQHKVEKLEKKKDKAEELLKRKKKEQGQAGRELAKIEQEIREMEVEMSKKKPKFIKAKERVSHMQKKLEGAHKNLEKARKANDAHLNDIRKLEEELAKVEAEQAEYEATIARESESQGRSVQLEDAQVREYHRLKEAAGKQSARYLQQLDSVNREQIADQDRLDNVYRMRTDAENKRSQKEHEKEEMQKRIEKLADHIRTNEQALKEKRKMCLELQSDVGTSKGRVLEIEKQLNEINGELEDSKIDNHEFLRNQRKQQVIERLKSKFLGVYGRLESMCQPIHQKYNVAVTKVLGKNMDAIIIDKEETARRCIQYLKEQMLEPETFLPLDNLKIKPLKDRLRNIKSPNNVKLLYDVLKLETHEIERAVLFATKNALVCETSDDANRVAYEIDTVSHNCVALDGTFYQKSGLISGGNLDLARKAKRWDEKHIIQLKKKKEKLSEELRELKKNSYKEFELNSLNLQILPGYELRIKLLRADLESTTKEVETVEKELKKLEKEIKGFVPTIAEIERTIQTRDKKIQDIKEIINNVEDVVFSRFCEQIGVSNIRQYEEHELRTQEQRRQKRFEFETQINAISNNLEFEKSRDTQNNVSRWERALHNDEEELESCRKAEAKYIQEIDNDMKNIEKLKSEKIARKQEYDQMEEEVGKAHREVSTIDKDIQTLQKQITFIEIKIENKKSAWNNILKQCKFDNLTIPMEDGNMESIPIPSENSEINTTITGSNNSFQQLTLEHQPIIIDYRNLSLSLQNLDDDGDCLQNKESILVGAIENIQDKLKNIKDPNLKATKKLDQISRELELANETLKNSLEIATNAKIAFEKVRNKRRNKFMVCFGIIENEINGIYKSLSQNDSAQAMIVLENPEEPFLHGIKYNCVLPGKQFEMMQYLSGGEKTVAALALMFAIISFKSAPFLIFDEMDAALDSTNIDKVASYICKKTENIQITLISLKDVFYNQADLILGTVFEKEECPITKLTSLDLSQF